MKDPDSKSQPNALPVPIQETLREPDRLTRIVSLPADPAGQRQGAKDAFLKVAGASVFAAQMQPLVRAGHGDNEQWGAELFIDAIRHSVQPRDAIEEMLVVQMAWTHARLARLSSIAHNQEQRGNVQVVHNACDRAANTFRRQMLTLAEYRRPAQPANFVAIRQANLANQQVVQNVHNSKSEIGCSSNEQGSAPPQALPAVAEGVEIATRSRDEESAVAVEQRPENVNRQRAVQDERSEAR